MNIEDEVIGTLFGYPLKRGRIVNPKNMKHLEDCTREELIELINRWDTQLRGKYDAAMLALIEAMRREGFEMVIEMIKPERHFRVRFYNVLAIVEATDEKLPEAVRDAAAKALGIEA